MAALAVIACFVLVQALTAGYGTRINDLPHIADYRMTGDVTARSSLERTTVVGESLDRESLDLWMVRYKLYSVEADEMMNIMALARAKASARLDPGYYQYGGAWLYPLGGWYLVLSKLGVISVGDLESYLAEPDRIDNAYVAGRLLVVAAVAVAGFLLFLSLIPFASPVVAVSAVAIFLFSPATVMLSQTMKPHWYALAFAMAAVWLLARTAAREDWTRRRGAVLGIMIGLCFGSATTFAPFTVFVWLALVGIWWWLGAVPARALVTVPAVAVAAFIALNPFMLLNWEAFRQESAALAGWFAPELTLDTVAGFLLNSGFRGFGFAFLGVALAVSAWQIVRPSHPALRGLGLMVLASVGFVAWLTASMVDWNINARYLPYLLPTALVLLGLIPGRRWGVVMAAVAVLTVIQSVPLIAAYWDENDPRRSTRLAAAAWIEANVPVGEGICVGVETPAPYHVPPLDFSRYRINPPDCGWRIAVTGDVVGEPSLDGWTEAVRFTPRLWTPAYPLVFGHINPRTTIYARDLVLGE